MWRPASGRPHVTYEQAIEEALCFGWIDGQAQTLDADRTALWLTRRRPGQRVEPAVQAAGRAGRGGRPDDGGRARGHRRRQARTARGRGTTTPTTWCCRRTSSTPSRPAAGAREHWESFSEAVRRGILRWIVDAKRDVTRAARIEETADLAEQGIPAHQQVRR